MDNVANLVSRGDALGVDLLRSIILEQQNALQDIESSARALASVLELVLLSKCPSAAEPATVDTTPPAPETKPALSKREREVLRLMVEGLSSKEIAARLGISFKTAVTHRASIMSKFDVHETASVVREAFHRGLV
ncbi:MAG TPA: LuxR C-terminal-related transcriptional regulator [Bryobacteraceae bacterium]|nr:LuxR C-terminal-related transcriptional regulator [Bryobacteraceae bacterium]